MKKILIIEDDEAIRAALKHDFEFEGFEVRTAKDGARGYELAAKRGFDLIILDILLPEMDGYSVCRRLKEKGVHTPIIMLTAARTEEMDKVLGLELGADDYVTKPVGSRELMARVKAVLRRAQDQASPPERFQFGDVAVDFKKHEVSRKGKIIPLTPIEFRLVCFLIKNRDRVVSRDEILDEVWENYVVSPHTIQPHITHLRQKIEKCPSNPKHIIAVRGSGYIFKIDSTE